MKRKKAAATRGMIRKKKTRSPSLRAVLFARKTELTVMDSYVSIKPSLSTQSTPGDHTWFTSASSLFNLLGFLHENIERTKYISWSSFVTLRGHILPTDATGTWICSPDPVLPLSQYSYINKQQGFSYVLLLVQHRRTEEMLQCVTNHCDYRMISPRDLFYVKETHSSFCRCVIKLSSTVMVKVWYTPKQPHKNSPQPKLLGRNSGFPPNMEGNKNGICDFKLTLILSVEHFSMFYLNIWFASFLFFWPHCISEI